MCNIQIVKHPKWQNILFSDRIVFEGDTVTILDETGSKALNDVNIKPFQIYKCMPFARSKSSIGTGGNESITFVSPESWLDPFEYFLYDKKAWVSFHKQLFCFCASFARSENEEALWKTYNSNTNSLHNIWCMNFMNLLDELNNQAFGITFYVVPIYYTKSKDDIRALKKQHVGSINDLVELLSYKRKAFKTDNEIRIFACVDSKQAGANNRLYVFNVNLTKTNSNSGRIIEKVILEPFPPYNNILSDPYLYAMKQHFRNLEMREFYQTHNVKVEESRLYLVNDIKKSTLKNRIAREIARI